MADMTSELKAKFFAAKSEEEAVALLKNGGVDETMAKKMWSELTLKREANGGELSLDELESVSGGYDRDYLKDGCAATVEPGSDCWGTDLCGLWPVTYINEPTRRKCPYCGKNLCSWKTEETFWTTTYYYQCPNCGRYLKSLNASEYEEVDP